jgi:hypothetical protein
MSAKCEGDGSSFSFQSIHNRSADAATAASYQSLLSRQAFHCHVHIHNPSGRTIGASCGTVSQRTKSLCILD